MSTKNGHRAKAHLKNKKKVLQRLRTRELRASLTIKPIEPATTLGKAETKSDGA